MSGLLLFSVAGLGGCSDDPDGINNELVLDRALTPLNFTASVLSTGNQVRLTWDVRTTDTYEVVIYSDEGLTTVVETKSDLTPADVPVTFDLVAENEYYATVQAFSQNERTAPSHVAVAGPIVTYAIMDPLNPVVTERTSNSVTLKWDQDQYVSAPAGYAGRLRPTRSPCASICPMSRCRPPRRRSVICSPRPSTSWPSTTTAPAAAVRMSGPVPTCRT